MIDSSPSPLTAFPEPRLARELAPGERVLWTGRSDAARVALNSWSMLLLGVFLTAFGSYAALIGWRNFENGYGAGRWLALGFAIAALLVLLLGLRALVSPLAAWFEARRTLYALTDRRLLILRGARVDMIPIGRFGAVDATPHPGGAVSIMIATGAAAESHDGEPWNTWLPAVRGGARLAALLRDVRAVETLH